MDETDNDGSKKPKPTSPDSPPDPAAVKLRAVSGDAFGAEAFDERDAWVGRNDRRLAADNRGAPLASLDNVVMILRNDPAFAGVLAYNEFSGMVVKRAAPPFAPTEPGEWTDLDDARLEMWLASNYDMRHITESSLQRGVMLAADQNRFHEVREFLHGLVWDGTPRLAHWLHLYLGAEQSEYAALAGTKFLVGAVARVMRSPLPVKMDNVLILEGPQDAGKSGTLKLLFSPWYTDAQFEIGSTDGNQIIRGMWGVELAEMDSYNRAEASKSKAFFSRDTDRYRNPYGRKPVNVVRQGVFAGTVNPIGGYLKDPTGNRRYWPVKCGYIALDELAADRDQLWAEALDEYSSGTVWWVRASESAIFSEAQEERYIGDAYEDRIQRYLEDVDVEGKKMQVSTGELLGKALGMEVSKWTMNEQQRVGRIMARMPGWDRRRKGAGMREWVYMRAEEGNGK